MRRLQQSIAKDGHDLAVSEARPDEEDRTAPAVDFEATLEGRTIGVEVTQLIPAARSHYEISAVDQHLRDTLGDIPREQNLGTVLLELEYGHIPAVRRLQADVARLEAQLRDALMDLQPEGDETTEIPVDPDNQTMVSARIRRLGDTEHRLVLMSGAREWGGNLTRQATRFVEDLLAKKAEQTKGWAEVWIVILDRVGLVGADAVARALGESVEEIPANWSRIYFIPASVDAPITALLREDGFSVMRSDRAD